MSRRKNRRGNVRNADHASSAQPQGSQRVRQPTLEPAQSCVSSNQKPTGNGGQSRRNTGRKFPHPGFVETLGPPSSFRDPRKSQTAQQPNPTGSRGQSEENAAPEDTLPNLELPHGSVAPNKKRTRRRRRSKPNATPRDRFPKLELPEGYLFPNKENSEEPRQRSEYQTMSDNFRPVKPWALDPRYPRPTTNDDKLHSFNYDRQWHSLEGKNVQYELLRALARGRRAQLPPLFKDSTPQELLQARRKYVASGEVQLYEIRMAYLDVPNSSKLSIVSTQAGSDKSSADDGNGLIKLLKIPELRKLVVDHLSPSIGDLTALAGTCKRIATCVHLSFEVWDFNSAVFPIEKFLAKEDDKGRPLQADGVRSDTLVVTQKSDRSALVKPYMANFHNFIKLCAAITAIPWSFKSIILDQIPFLDVATFEMMVNSMPNLSAITVTRCLLLDVTKLKPLLEVIQRHPRAAGGQEGQSAKYICLDFFPFFFRGPQSSKRLGSYGVTYNEPTFHTPKAVFGLILQCWDLSQTVGMDLVSNSSAFWSFVRQLPGPDVLWAIKARDALITREHDLGAGIKDKEVVLQAFADDITAALTGDGYKPGNIPWRMGRHFPDDHHRMGYWRKDWMCNSCHFTYPASLFPIRPGTCWSCKMKTYVTEMESSHLRLSQLSAMQHWREGLCPLSATLDDLLRYREGSLDGAIWDVRAADWAWEYFLRFQPREGVEPYVPPEPEGIDSRAKSLARWRWWRSPVTGPFDYREGGPQFEDPCKFPLGPSSYEDEDDGPEPMANYNRRWRWTAKTNEQYLNAWIEEFNRKSRHDRTRGHHDARDIEAISDPRAKRQLEKARNSQEECRIARDAERRAQNGADKALYTYHNAQVEDCLVSLFTPASLPFNLDKPIIHESVNPRAYYQFVQAASRSYLPYTSIRNNSYW
ncbi:hypothetical protein MFIFM68171_00240 [Madurella fahalii]|uniref:F-box domain-containing protein n=1 Tax=Madurella fahalii TaxID=1157608 RepID=A0ABQ0FX00_9PEZI